MVRKGKIRKGSSRTKSHHFGEIGWERGQTNQEISFRYFSLHFLSKYSILIWIRTRTLSFRFFFIFPHEIYPFKGALSSAATRLIGKFCSAQLFLVVFLVAFVLFSATYWRHQVVCSWRLKRPISLICLTYWRRLHLSFSALGFSSLYLLGCMNDWSHTHKIQIL